MASLDFTKAPENLPRPQDDGACRHLIGSIVPSLQLKSTTGSRVDLSKLPGLVVLFCYPMTGKPGTPLPPGWDDIPGARGCTPQACSYKDNSAELAKYGASLFGMSTQTTAYQSEAAQRLHLPFALLSDEKLELAHALQLPTFQVKDVGQLIKRLTLILEDGRIVKSLYPIFPSDSDVPQVLQWLCEHGPTKSAA